jgi:flagellar protein FlaJ
MFIITITSLRRCLRRLASRRPRPGYTLSETYTALALMLFEGLARRLASTFQFESVFRRGAITSHPVIYSARILLNTLVSAAVVTFPLGVAAVTIAMPLISRVVLVLIGVIVPIVVLATGFAYPYIKISARNAAASNELPFFLVYAATMARGGLGLELVMERVANLKLFVGMRAEAQRVLARVKFFGEDPITALDKIAMDHPNSRFRDVILGYTTTLKIGGDVLHYLQIRTEEVLNNRINDIKALIGRLASYLEAYIVFGVIVSLTVFILFASMGAVGLAAAGSAAIIPVGFTSDNTFIMLYNFLIVPLIGILVLIAINYTLPKTPLSIREPLFLLLLTLPIGIVVGAVIALTISPKLLAGISTGRDLLALLLGLVAFTIVTFTPPAYDYHRASKKTRGLVRNTASFLRDLSETRKTGLSPERCIINLSSRTYGTLTPVVKKIAAALYSGLPVEVAVSRALRGLKEWFTLITFRFLVDSISVGGGSPEVVDALARFTAVLAESEIELKRRLKTYVILPYFGAILLASAPVIILWMLTSFAGSVEPSRLIPTIASLSVGSYINTVIMGLIAGVTSEQSICAGFKHVVAMALVAVAASVATLFYIGLV